MEGYIANWKNYPDDEIKIRVARPSVLAPSKELLDDYKSGKIRWDEYERRFRKEMNRNPKALKKLIEISELARDRNVRLMCYEKKPPCHRFILIEILVWLQAIRADIEISGLPSDVDGRLFLLERC
jgi:uncharacterized protein YeaO (DUF488 family)